MTPDELKKAAKKMNVDISKLDTCVAQGRIRRVTYDGQCYLTLPHIDVMESQAAHDAIRILKSNTWKKVPNHIIDKYISIVEQDIGITLHTQQREAVKCMVNNSLCVITGGPGTGKTCTLSVAVKVIELLHAGVDVRFTAPTGKASGRINESLKIETAQTIQRELKIGYNKKDPDVFRGDVLVVDEVSMLDMEIANLLFKSIPTGSRLILVGDTEQLPSVGYGAVLRDLIDSEVIPFVMLTKTFRQAEESALMANILKTKVGDNTLINDKDEFEIIDANKDRDKAVDELCDIYMDAVNEYGIDNVCCLLPFRKSGNLCSNYINSMLQKRINPLDSKGKRYIKTTLDNKAKVTYMLGDPVMQLVNRQECANGDVGKVVFIEGDVMKVDFNGTLVRYYKRELPEQLSLAYAMSINKSQGSEYKCVIVCMVKEHSIMLTRNMLYTGITRAKKKCILYQDKEAIGFAMKQTAMYKDQISGGRMTFLADKLAFAANRIFVA